MNNVRTSIAGLCKGSTADSDSVCEGSNPSPAATKDLTFVYHDKSEVFAIFHAKWAKIKKIRVKQGFEAVQETASKLLFHFQSRKIAKKAGVLL